MKKVRLSQTYALLYTIMKISCLQLALVCVLGSMAFAYDTKAQETLNKVIDLKIENENLKKVLAKIEKQASVKFAYSQNVIDAERKVTMEATGKSLSVVLSELLGPLDLSYEVMSDRIVLTKAKAKNAQAESKIENENLKDGIVISGRVIDEKGEGVPGATISLKGTTKGTAADFEGKYQLSLGDDVTPETKKVLVFSLIGYITQEVEVSSQTEINVQLQPDVKLIDEVVVVGYGTQKKSDLTGSIAVVNASEMKKQATNDVGQMLQGRAPGVMVSSDGQPGASPTVMIRGIGSLFSGTEPLYVVDGVPLVTGIRDFSPNDIESMQVLKDASAGAIYGSRAANGVVIITTKRGAKGRPMSVDYSGYYGVQEITKTISVTDRVGYQTINNEIRLNSPTPVLAPANDPTSSSYITDINTNWQKSGLKTGMITNHNIALSGGGKDASYNVAFDYFKNNGTMVGNGPDYTRYTFRVNTDYQKDRFKFGESFFTTYSTENTLNILPSAGAQPAQIVDLVSAIPTMPIYDPNRLGGYGGTSTDLQNAISLNVIGSNSLTTSKTDVLRTFANAYGEYAFVDKANTKLKYRLNLGFDRTQANDNQFVPTYDLGYFYQNSLATLFQKSREYTNAVVENTLNLEHKTGKHNFAILAGQTFYDNTYKELSAYGTGFPEPYKPVMNQATTSTSNGYQTEARQLSFLGRVNYSYDDRYMITATMRGDASSKFSPNNHWGTFPSVALAWKMHNEKFLKLPTFISNLKLRGSYGSLGNQNIGDYLYYGYVNTNQAYNFNNTKANGSIQTTFASQNIKWETKTISNLGLDVGLFSNKIEFTAEYYYAKTTDALVQPTLPATVGNDGALPYTNFGSFRNSGFEFNMTYRKQEGAFRYEITGNAFTVNNRILSLGYTDAPIYGAGSINQVGGEIGALYGYVTEGIFQTKDEVAAHAVQVSGTDPIYSTQPGDIKYKDLDGNGAIDFVTGDGNKDKTILGSAIPKVYYGLNFTAGYKNFDLTIFASGSAGNKAINSMYRGLMSYGNNNYSTDMLNAWTATNTNTNVPRLIQNDPNHNQYDSDRWIQDASYVRITTFSVGYTIPASLLKKIKGFSKARVYVTCQNLYTFTGYNGYNPDFSGTATSGSGGSAYYNGFQPGWDAGSYPKPRTIMGGIQLSF